MTLQAILKSSDRLKQLVCEELQADAACYGDDRRSPVVERHAAKILDESVSTEPVTIILSDKSWMRLINQINPLGHRFTGPPRRWQHIGF